MEEKDIRRARSLIAALDRRVDNLASLRDMVHDGMDRLVSQVDIFVQRAHLHLDDIENAEQAARAVDEEETARKEARAYRIDYLTNYFRSRGVKHVTAYDSVSDETIDNIYYIVLKKQAMERAARAVEEEKLKEASSNPKTVWEYSDEYGNIIKYNNDDEATFLQIEGRDESED